MRPPRTQEATAEPSPVEVVRCERVEAGAHASLVRVTLALGATSPADAAGAQLVAEDRGTTRRIDALPCPMPAGATTLTLGFAAPKTATPLGLVLGRTSFALPAPDEARRDAERRLRAVQARLEASRGICAVVATERDAALRVAAQAETERDEALRAAAEADADREAAARASAHAERERDEALRAVARAEAAAHDASARAESLALRSPEAAPPSAGRGRRPRSRRAAAGACALAVAALLVTILAWPARDGGSNERVGAAARASAAEPPRPTAPAVDPLAARLNIPARYLALYRRAAARYGLDWTRLAAVGAIESGHGQDPITGIVAGANLRGAAGPAQFLPGTWERFGLDGDGDGDRDPYDPADAIFAMASYLRASGAPQDWRGALRAYNHSDAYVTSVETLAASLRSDAA